MSSYIIGIDLGTTNCTMAYAEKGSSQISLAAIPQMVEGQLIGERDLLPSFVYFPLPEETFIENYCVGSYARDRGGELPTHLIASAKSWLCHGGIDRREKLLPVAAEEAEKRMSPLEASAALLKQLREAWDSQMAHAPFKEQQVLITVPASFDPSARQLVLEAAEAADYPEVVLLEEPQAAFYGWIHAHAEEWRQQLKVDETVLVIDIGGGTTDFSLISVVDDQGNMGLKRLAVGAHLLLGGDNFDLALAYLARNKLEEQGHAIDDWQFQSLIHRCREAKEQLLGDRPPESVEIAIQGRGSRLIGGSLNVAISQKEALDLLVEGFAPMVGPEERSTVERRSGIQQIGLPYAQDARISCQLAKFLSMTGEVDSASMEQFVVPSAVLFNGGTLRAAALRTRFLELLNSWAKILKKPAVIELPGADYDFAVSRGAVTYGMARTGQGVRIKGGTSRSYWIGVEDAVPAVPGLPMPLRAVCIVPFGMEEGSEQLLQEKEFALILGELATFRFFSHATPTLSTGQEAVIGTVVRNWKQELTELHPIEANLPREEGDGKTVRVKIRSHVTEMGTLEVWCEAVDGRRWKLEFDIRATVSSET
jgi:hypothetical protein